jgi:trigger factor
MKIDVPEDQISQEVRNRLQSISRTARIAGFRPGKAPLKVVEQRYASRVREEVVGEMLRRSFADAVMREHLRPAGAPLIDAMSSAPGEGLSYTAVFEVYPEIAMKPTTDLKLTKTVCEVADADVDRMVETLRRQRRRWRPVERAAASGDQVTIDFTGKVDGAEFAGGRGQDFELELGAGRFIPAFEDGLIGKGIGNHTVPVTFPSDYPASEFAGKEAVFEVTVKKVSEPELPELNAEFFQVFGVQDGSLETFKAEVRKNIERERDQAVRTRTKHGVFNALIEANPVQLPKALVENEARRLLEQTRHGLASRGVPRGRTESLTADAFRPQAERRVALALLMGDIIQKHGLEADPARVRAMLEQLAAGYDDPVAVVKWYYEDEQRLNEVKTAVLEDQLVELLLGQATVAESSVSFDDLMNPRQTETESKASA